MNAAKICRTIVLHRFPLRLCAIHCPAMPAKRTVTPSHGLNLPKDFAEEPDKKDFDTGIRMMPAMSRAQA
jgi:hypothetical protein